MAMLGPNVLEPEREKEIVERIMPYPHARFLKGFRQAFFATLLGALFFLGASPLKGSGAEDRSYTIQVLQRLADPVLIPLSENQLSHSVPKRDWEIEQGNFHTSPLQAFVRVLSGIGPWLSLGAGRSGEGKLRARYIALARKGIINATNPEAADFMFGEATRERIVHAHNLAYPLMVAREQLWDPLTADQKENVVKALKTHRGFEPFPGTWLWFSAIIEAALWELTGDFEIEPIEIAISKYMEWYIGDGYYTNGSGSAFNWDNYNSYVSQPLMLETLRICRDQGHSLGAHLDKAKPRAFRYAEVLEHMISPEGTFPVIGRSSTYRFAVLQHLGYVGARVGWPDALKPGATRAAMTAVIRRMVEAPGTFDENGWLQPGYVGHQPSARDAYNNTGALYNCALGLAHLGMPADHPYWTEPPSKWFQQRVWSGEDVKNQKPYRE